MSPLLEALEKLGVTTDSQDGKCPVSVTGPLKGGSTTVDGISSQFLSSLLISCPAAPADSVITVTNLQEKPYVKITLKWLKDRGITYTEKDMTEFTIPGNQTYDAFTVTIPADFSTATFPLCAAAVSGSKLTLNGLDFSDTQGDKEVFSHFEKMGVSLEHNNSSVTVVPGPLKACDIDLNNTPDALPALATAACFAEGTTRLYNVKNARLKECDRISAMAAELGKMGAKVIEKSDELIITGGQLKGAQVEGYNDHRIVMSLCIAGLAAEGETIVTTPEAAKITYPDFFRHFSALGASYKLI
jgi:3-phosphoshikimate 1-carboxyvinyltransferase